MTKRSLMLGSALGSRLSRKHIEQLYKGGRLQAPTAGAPLFAGSGGQGGPTGVSGGSKGRKGGWVAAKDLKPGDQVRLADGSKAFVTSVKKTEVIEPVYNFTVEGFHTYHVGELGVWVHNTNCGELFDNLDPKSLARELAQAQGLGVKTVTVTGVNDTIRAMANSGERMKWSITEAGDLRLMPKFVGGEEISHTVLSAGGRVRGAGEVDLYLGPGGQVIIDRLSPHSGHFMRNNTESLNKTVVGRGLDAFKNLGFGVLD